MPGPNEAEIELEPNTIGWKQEEQQQQQQQQQQPQGPPPTYYQPDQQQYGVPQQQYGYPQQQYGYPQQQYAIQQQPYSNQPQIVYITAPHTPVEPAHQGLVCFAWFWAIIAAFVGGLFCSIPACVFASNRKYKQSLIFSTVGIVVGVVFLVVFFTVIYPDLYYWY